MIIYSTIKKQEMRLDYIRLAEKMWFKEKDGRALDISNGGNTETLQSEFFLSLSLNKWKHDEAWSRQAVNI